MALPDDLPLHSIGLLSIFLGGSDTSFTGQLLLLITKADPGNRAKLRAAFPEVVRAWEVWQTFRDAPTSPQLRAALDAATGDAASAGT